MRKHNHKRSARFNRAALQWGSFAILILITVAFGAGCFENFGAIAPALGAAAGMPILCGSIIERKPMFFLDPDRGGGGGGSAVIDQEFRDTVLTGVKSLDAKIKAL